MLTVLFFDDEPMVGSGFARFFKGRGITLDAVSDKRAFDRKVRQRTHRIIALDELLAGSPPGSMLCRDLRVRGESRPILLTSHATSDAEGRARADECGADLYVPKFEEAVYRGLKTIGQIDPHRPPPVPKSSRRVSYRHALTCEEIEIDLDRNAATSKSAPLRLTPTEFAAFAYLLKRAPDLVTVGELRIEVWKTDSITASAISNIVGQIIERVPRWIERVDRGYRARVALPLVDRRATSNRRTVEGVSPNLRVRQPASHFSNDVPRRLRSVRVAERKVLREKLENVIDQSLLVGSSSALAKHGRRRATTRNRSPCTLVHLLAPSPAAP